eukprot:12406880-Ditylum_brightwellii.AAC.1
MPADQPSGQLVQITVVPVIGLLFISGIWGAGKFQDVLLDGWWCDRKSECSKMPKYLTPSNTERSSINAVGT